MTLFGTGGAARAALVAFKLLEIETVRIQARDMAAATKLAVEFGLALAPRPLTETVDTDVLVNATPLGMEGYDCLNCDLSRMPDEGLVFDMVSAPADTPLVVAARARGLAVVTGLDMLVEQAAIELQADVRGRATARPRRRPVRAARPMITLALTGSIGTGKSTVAAMFADAGIALFDADATVRALQGSGGRLVAPIESRFPGTTRDGAVDREALAAAVLGHPAELAALEALVHPAVHDERTRFIAANGAAPALLFDIPLLFETGGEAAFDNVIVVSAPAALQRERVLARPGMTAAKLDAILARQLPDADKRARADFVIDTSGSLTETRAQVNHILACLGLADGCLRTACAKSFSTPKPRASARRGATASSRSAASR